MFTCRLNREVPRLKRNKPVVAQWNRRRMFRSPLHPVAAIGDETALCAPPSSSRQGKWRAMQERQRFELIDPLDYRLSEEAERLRKEARGTPPGVERDRLTRRARLAETASHMSEWLSSKGLQPPT